MNTMWLIEGWIGFLSERVDFPPPPHPTSSIPSRKTPRTNPHDLAQDIASSCSIRNVLIKQGLYRLGSDNHSRAQPRPTKFRLGMERRNATPPPTNLGEP